MSLDKTTQDLTLQSMLHIDLLQSDRLIARSIASTDIDGRKSIIATYTFCRNKTLTDSEHKEFLSKSAQAHDHKHYFGAGP